MFMMQNTSTLCFMMRNTLTPCLECRIHPLVDAYNLLYNLLSIHIINTNLSNFFLNLMISHRGLIFAIGTVHLLQVH